MKGWATVSLVEKCHTARDSKVEFMERSEMGGVYDNGKAVDLILSSLFLG
jgi:hypothetical protein